MRVLTNLQELDEQLQVAAAASRRSPDEFRKVLDGFILDPKGIVGRMPRNPRGADYRAAQMRLYEAIAETSYRTENEKTPFDHEHMMRWPFPYSTRSSSMVGDYLMTYGNLIKVMGLANDARILEIGSGYGPLTYHLASMGHHVTCVDVHEPLLKYVEARTALLPGKVETIHSDMNGLELNDSFDAIIFFESFHHGSDHVGMLERLKQWLEPNGVLVLAGEPIVPAGSQAVPYPWGLRMDGLSLWFIRKLGWLELGFEEEYLRELLEDTGWSVICVPNHATPQMGVWLAKLSEAAPVSVQGPIIAEWDASSASLKTQTGVLMGDPAVLCSEGRGGYLQFGPYATLEPGFYEVQWEGRASAGATGRIDIARDGGATIVRGADFRVEADRIGPSGVGFPLRLRFRLDSMARDLEFRVRVDEGSDVDIHRILLRKR